MPRQVTYQTEEFCKMKFITEYSIILATALSEARGISIGEALDILRETLTKCTDTIAGESEYSSVSEVIRDYLDLGESWSKLFMK